MSKYRLTCGHDIMLDRPVMKKERVRCEVWPCGGMYRTVDFVHGEYRIKCEDCKFGRRFGRAKVTAGVAASKHAIRHVHRVRVWSQGPDSECDVRHIPRQEKSLDRQNQLW